MKEVISSFLNFLPGLLDKTSNRQPVLNALILMGGLVGIGVGGWFIYKEIEVNAREMETAKKLVKWSMDGQCSLWEIPYQNGNIYHALEKHIAYDVATRSVIKYQMVFEKKPDDIDAICDNLKKGFMLPP